MVMSRHEFLARLHYMLRPKVYLEIGVQYGTSLNLARYSDVAIGIDPNPLVRPQGNQAIYPVESGTFFTNVATYHPTLGRSESIDMAFIDGMHLFEYALRDFIDVERFCNRSAVVVFDDVLPRNEVEASRTQPPGDWTGDVWKVADILVNYRRDLTVHLVNTEPTGTMVVFNVDPQSTTLWERYKDLEAAGVSSPLILPEDIKHRWNAITAEEALVHVYHHQYDMKRREHL